MIRDATINAVKTWANVIMKREFLWVVEEDAEAG